MVSSPTIEISTREERATRLSEALRRRGVKKLYGLALDLGVDQSAISRWRKGGAMSLDHAARLCAHLGISMDWLVLGRGPMEPGRAVDKADKQARTGALLQTMTPALLDAFLTVMLAVRPDAGGTP